jgi:hypothetical protein
VFRRKGTKFWWIRYRDRTGTRRAEPTGTADWKEAQKKLRERLQARDENVLEIVCKGEELTVQQWAELFLENYSKPPLRTPKTHEANTRAVTHLLPDSAVTNWPTCRATRSKAIYVTGCVSV